MPDPCVIKTWQQDGHDMWRLVYTGATYQVQEATGDGWRAEPQEHAFAVLASLVAEEEGFDA